MVYAGCAMLLTIFLATSLFADGGLHFFEVTEIESNLLLHAHGDEVEPGACLMIVDLENRSSKPLTLVPELLELFDDQERLCGRCRYERALVWQSNDRRRRFTSFDFPLAPNESVQVKLFYAFEGQDASDLVERELHYRAGFTVGESKVVVESEPFAPSVLRGL